MPPPFFAAGDVLYEILQCVKQQRRSAGCDTPNLSPSLENGPMQDPPRCRSVQEPPSPTDNNVQGQHDFVKYNDVAYRISSLSIKDISGLYRYGHSGEHKYQTKQIKLIGGQRCDSLAGN